MQNGNPLLTLFAIQVPHTQGCHFAILAFIDPSDGRCDEERWGIPGRFYAHVFLDLRIQIWQVSEFVVQRPSILLGYIFDLHEGGESRKDILFGEDEYLGGSDRVEPFIDPAPDDRKK